MIKAYEMTGESKLANNTPVALAVRWFDRAEAEINGDNIEGKDGWQKMLDRLETIAMVDPSVLLEIARLQSVREYTLPEDRIFETGCLIQLGLMSRMLDDRARSIEETFSVDPFPSA